MQDFSLCIVKISQGLRKVRNHSKNFAIPAKFRYARFFAMIAKFRYHSESYCALRKFEFSLCLVFSL